MTPKSQIIKYELTLGRLKAVLTGLRYRLARPARCNWQTSQKSKNVCICTLLMFANRSRSTDIILSRPPCPNSKWHCSRISKKIKLYNLIVTKLHSSIFALIRELKSKLPSKSISTVKNHFKVAWVHVFPKVKSWVKKLRSTLTQTVVLASGFTFHFK